MLINTKEELEKFKIKSRGFVLVGAHLGTEVKIFKDINPSSSIYLFEPQIELYKKLKNIFKNEVNVEIYNYAIGDKKEKLTMYKDTNNDSQSSSILKPKDHLKYHSYINFKKDLEEIINVETLDSFKIEDANILCIDVQGYELKVLQGSKNFLKKCDALLIEINRKEMYEGCPHVTELDKFLKLFNLYRVKTSWWQGTIPWGDALYIKKNYIGKIKKFKITLVNKLNHRSFVFFILSKINSLKKVVN